mgnify:CR=1 FL=1
MVERANYEVTRFLTACVADVDVRANWPTYIPFVQRIMNTMIKTSTGVQIHNETTEFPIGSYVLAEYETGKSSKFHTKRHGPYRVINKLGPIYSLKNLVTNKITDFHVLLLSEYHHDDDNSDIYKVLSLQQAFSKKGSFDAVFKMGSLVFTISLIASIIPYPCN